MEFTELINNVGFPIAISIALFYQLIKMNEIVREFQSTIDKNTFTMKQLLQELTNMNKKVG